MRTALVAVFGLALGTWTTSAFAHGGEGPASAGAAEPAPAPPLTSSAGRIRAFAAHRSGRARTHPPGGISLAESRRPRPRATPP